MIRKIDHTLGDEECEYLFLAFDRDKSGTIEFNEFSKLLIT